jgi:hypothetical protein
MASRIPRFEPTQLLSGETPCQHEVYAHPTCLAGNGSFASLA